MRSVSMFGVVVFTLALLGNRTTEPYKGHILSIFVPLLVRFSLSA